MSRPRCLAGDFSSRSTFSKRQKGGRLAIMVSRICHHRTPFFPSIPWEEARVWATL